MTEHPNNEQECDFTNLHDKENQSDSLEPTQTKHPSTKKPNPLQESQSCNLPTNPQDSTNKESGPLSAKRTNNSNWLNEIRRKSAEKKKEKNQKSRSTRGIKRPLTTPREGTPKTAKKHSETEPEGSRETSDGTHSVVLTFEFKNRKIKIAADPNETIIDSLVRNSILNKDEKKFPIISIARTNAVINPWVPCEAVNSEETLQITLKNIKPPEPSVYSKSSDLKRFTVKTTKKTLRKVLGDLRYSDNKPLVVYGYKDESIREALERDTRFDVTSAIVRNKVNYSPYISIHSENRGADLSYSVPCEALEEGEELTLSIRQGRVGTSPELSDIPSYPDGMFFKLDDKKQNLKSKLREKHYYNGKPLAVYGRKDESIEEALTNDERFNITGEFVLRHSGEPDCRSDVHLSVLKQENFYVICEGKKCGKRRVSKMQDTQTSDGTRLNVPHDSPTFFTNTPKRNAEYASLLTAVSTKFYNAFNNLPIDVTTKIWRQSLKNYKSYVLYKSPITAELLDTLHKRMGDVAIIGHLGTRTAVGTVFFLTQTLALTCHHVIKYLMESCNTYIFDIVFNYDKEPFINSYYSIKVKMLFASEEHDFAFLSTETCNLLHVNHPKGLLPYVALPPTQGAVSIIGHPGGKCKKLDVMCSVMDFNDEDTADTIFSDKAHVHLFTRNTFNEVRYDSCMYRGSSGAPVFNDRGMLVAMHTGGYIAEIGQNLKTMVEYGRSICDIIEYGIQHNPTIWEQLKDFRDIISRNSRTPEDCEMTEV